MLDHNGHGMKNHDYYLPRVMHTLPCMPFQYKKEALNPCTNESVDPLIETEPQSSEDSFIIIRFGFPITKKGFVTSNLCFFCVNFPSHAEYDN